MELSSDVWVALLVAFLGGGTIGSVYAIRANRKLKSAQAGTLIADAALALLKPYQEQVKLLGNRVDMLTKHDRDKTQRIASLENDARVTRTAMLALEMQYEELQHANEMLKDSNEYLFAGVLELIEQLRRLGHEPGWEPDEPKWRGNASKDE